MITFRFPLVSVISGSDCSSLVSVTEASDSGETLMAAVNNSVLEQRQTASVVPLSFPVALQLLLRGYTTWIWGLGVAVGGVRRGRKKSNLLFLTVLSPCFHFFCTAVQ